MSGTQEPKSKREQEIETYKHLVHSIYTTSSMDLGGIGGVARPPNIPKNLPKLDGKLGGSSRPYQLVGLSTWVTVDVMTVDLIF